MADLERLEQERQDSIQFMSKRWHTFFKKFKEIDDIKVSQWKHVHVLGYFDKRFRKLYNKNFSYSFKSVPSKCPEMVFIKQIYAILNTTNTRTVKQFIDWVFDTIIIPKQMKIRTVAFFKTPGLGNSFYEYKSEQEIIKRSTVIPNKYKDIIKNLNIPVNTFGDLAFIKMALKNRSGNSNDLIINKYNEMFMKLYSVGFEDKMIEGLK